MYISPQQLSLANTSWALVPEGSYRYLTYCLLLIAAKKPIAAICSNTPVFIDIFRLLAGVCVCACVTTSSPKVNILASLCIVYWCFYFFRIKSPGWDCQINAYFKCNRHQQPFPKGLAIPTSISSVCEGPSPTSLPLRVSLCFRAFASLPCDRHLQP